MLYILPWHSGIYQLGCLWLLVAASSAGLRLAACQLQGNDPLTGTVSLVQFYSCSAMVP
jgi:hypothetical protein